MASDEITRSKDPKLVACRVFVGSLPSDRTSREELEEKFGQYGKILGISIHQGYAFVQYDEENAAIAAVQSEHGCFYKGKKLDLRIASEGKTKGVGRGGPPMKRPHDDYMPPGRPEFDDPGFHHRPPPPWEREQYPPGPVPVPMPNRGPEQFRDDSYRYGPLPPGGPPPLEPFHRGETFSGPPGPKRVEYGVERPFDSVIIAVNKHLKMYAEMVERKLIELSMTVDVIFLVHDDALLKAIDDMTRRGVLYILIVQPQNEERKSITVNIMHGAPQEHRNMPLDEALTMLARNFKAYLSSLRTGSDQPSLGFLLNILADGKPLSVDELDRIISHLQDRRDRMVEADGGKIVPRNTNMAPTPGNPADQLQQRIFGMLGGTTAPAAATTNANPAAVFASIAQQFGLNVNAPPRGVAPPISTPDVKPTMSGPDLSKLDSLLSNPGFLKTLGAQANALQGGNRPPNPAASFPPMGGMPPMKQEDYGIGSGARQPQPPPMAGRGGPGTGF